MTPSKLWGFLGVIVYAIVGFGFGCAFGYSSVGSGILAILVGGGAIAGLVAITRWRLSHPAMWSWGIGRRVAFGSAPALLIFGSVWGMLGAHKEAIEKVSLCKQGEQEATGHLASHQFLLAYKSLNAARANCGDSEKTAIERLYEDVKQQEKEAAVAAAATREAQAVQTFPEKSTEIATAYQKVVNEIARSKWADADGDLRGAETELASFGGTGVVQSKPYQDLDAKLHGARQKIDAHLQQLKDQQDAKERAQAEADAKAEKPEPCVTLARTFGEGSSLTDLQKDEAWKQFAGQYFQLDLRVSEVQAGLLGGVHVLAECANGPELWFPIQIEYDNADWAKQLTKGQVWRLKGKLGRMTLGTMMAKGCSQANCE